MCSLNTLSNKFRASIQEIKNKLLALAALLMLLPSLSYASLLVVTDASQLDFSGDFLYAVNFNGSGATTIGDASFTNVALNGTGLPAGVSFSGFDRQIASWGATNIGAGADNDGLENVMKSIIWSLNFNPGTIDAAISIGTNYRLQLFFSEACCNSRHFDVNAEGSLIEEIKGTVYGGTWANSATQGYALQHDFTATDNNLDIDFLRHAPGDTNYVVSGFTVERVPEPTTLLLLGLGLAGLGFSKRRRV